MKKVALAVLLIALLSWGAAFVLPWWVMAVVAFGVALALRLSPGRAFLAGFIAIALLWAGLLLYADWRNDGLLAGRMAMVFSLPGRGFFLLVNMVVGALVGGLGAWCGGLMRRAFFGASRNGDAMGAARG